MPKKRVGSESVLTKHADEIGWVSRVVDWNTRVSRYENLRGKAKVTSTNVTRFQQ